MTNPAAPRHTELAGFLRAKRERLRPDDVGLPAGGRRRTPGLRRQEVAQLAAVSVEWYIRLEQGRVGAPGVAVLDGLAQALRLTPAEREHLHLIARGEAPVTAHVPTPISSSLRVLLDGMPLVPAYVVDFRLDVLAHNAAAAALLGETFGTGTADNIARLMFLEPALRASQLDWTRIARETVGNLRANHARHRDDRRLLAVVAELCEHSTEFAAWWDDRTVVDRANGRKRVRHPSAGELALSYDVLATREGSGQCLIAVTPADEPSERALRSLMIARAGKMNGEDVHPIAAAWTEPALPVRGVLGARPAWRPASSADPVSAQAQAQA